MSSLFGDDLNSLAVWLDAEWLAGLMQARAMSAHSTPPLASTSRFFTHDPSHSGQSTPLSLSASADDSDAAAGTGTGDGGADDDDLDEDEEAWDEVDIPQAGAETGQAGEAGEDQGAAEGADAATAAERAAKGIEIVISRGGQAGAKGKGKGCVRHSLVRSSACGAVS